MAKKPRKTHDVLKEKTLNAAEKIVRNQGLSALTARAIATEVGYALGTLYNMFENLDDVILHVNARTLDTMHDEMKPARSITALAKVYIRFAGANPHVWNMLFEHTQKTSGTLPEWYQARIERMFSLAEALLAKEIETDKKSLKRSTKVLWASIHGICSLSLNGTLETTKSEPASVLAEALIDAYINGVRRHA